MTKEIDTSIIAVDKFIRATRDSGYKNTVSAISELIDNSLQANASRIDVFIEKSDASDDHPIRITVLDNGDGMTKGILHQSLRFGGTSRFDDRNGLGRYGMGLPNASLSQAKRLQVCSWRSGRIPYSTYIDVDEIAKGKMVRIPEPEVENLPPQINGSAGTSGTLVQWFRCDRLDNRRISTLERKLFTALGRMFRFYIWNEVVIAINDKEIKPIDPLYLHSDSVFSGAGQFQETLEYEVRAPTTSRPGSDVGSILVTFSELPVHEWHSLPNEEKRRLGVSNGAGVSIVRGGREIEYGWFFMGSKRRENYDDWWRCEIRFDPVLDEAFGITHTKQQIRPQEYLQDILVPEISMIAKALNNRVRHRHLQLKTAMANKNIESLASEKDASLKPLPKQRQTDTALPIFNRLSKKHDVLRQSHGNSQDIEYRLIEDVGTDTTFFTPLRKNGQVVILINKLHPFYKKIYGPLLAESVSKDSEQLKAIQMMLIAAARAELSLTRKSERDLLAVFRNSWSEVLDVFIRN